MNCKIVNRTNFRTSDLKKLCNLLYQDLRWDASKNPGAKEVCVVVAYEGDDTEPEVVANTLKDMTVKVVSVPRDCNTTMFIAKANTVAGFAEAHYEWYAKAPGYRLRLKPNKTERQIEKILNLTKRQKALQKYAKDYERRANDHARRYHNYKKRTEKAKRELETVSKALTDLQIQQPGG